MSFDIGEALARASELRSSRKRQQEIAPASLLRMAAVSMENLVGREEWDSYLKLLAARSEDLTAAIVQTREALASPVLVNYEQIMMLKLRQATLQGALDATEGAIRLPHEIISAVQRAPADG